MADQEKKPRHSPASRALRALLPGIVPLLEAEGIHRTDTYRWARAETIPNAERAATIERIDPRVQANAWTPDGLGEDGQEPGSSPVATGRASGDAA